MKILHITKTYTPLGGVEQYLLNVAGLLQGAGHSNAILYRQDHPATIRSGSFPAFFVPEEPGRGEATLGRIARIIQDERVDLVFLHTLSDALLVEDLTRRVPTVGYIHGFVPTCPGRGKFFGRGEDACTRPFGPGCAAMIYLRRCSEARHPRTVYNLLVQTRAARGAAQTLGQVLVASTYMQAHLIQNGFDPARIHILPPHFEEPFSAQPSPAIDPPAGRAPAALPQILFAGRLEAEKGLPYLLRAVATMSTPCRLLIAGDGSRRIEYETLARRLNLEGRVAFLGWQDQATLGDLYQQAALLVVPSIFPEPFGKVGIEALSRGRPVVAFAVGGIPDWLIDGYNGLLVPPRAVDRLAFQIDRLLQDPPYARQLGARGLEYVAKNFSPQHYLTRLLAIFAGAQSPAGRLDPIPTGGAGRAPTGA